MSLLCETETIRRGRSARRASITNVTNQHVSVNHLVGAAIASYARGVRCPGIAKKRKGLPERIAPRQAFVALSDRNALPPPAADPQLSTCPTAEFIRAEVKCLDGRRAPQPEYLYLTGSAG